MDPTVQNLQFINLDEISSSEAEYVQSLLYSERSTKLELPWIDQEEQQWDQEQQFDGEAEVYDGGGSNEVYHQVQVPNVVATTLPQMYHHPTQVIPPIANLTYPGNMHQTPNIGFGLPPMVPYPVYQDNRRPPRGAKASPKRNRDYQPNIPPYTQFSIPLPYHQYISGMQPPAMPTAQHATGHPLYVTNAIPVYHIPYPTTVYSTVQPPLIHQEDLKAEVEKEVEKIEPDNSPKHEEKPTSFPVDAIRKTSLPPMPPPTKRREEPPPPPPKQQPQPQPQPQPKPKPTQQPLPQQEEPASFNAKSWAQITAKNAEQPQTLPKNTFKPPLNAVPTSAPPRYDIKNQQSNQEHQDKEDIDPQLKNLGEVLTNYTLDHKSTILTPRGLKNPSNYCYINAILQALLACPAFYNLIKVISEVKHATQNLPSDRQGNHLKSKTPIIDSVIQFVKEFSPAPVAKFSKRDRPHGHGRKDKEENLYDMPLVGVPFEPTYMYRMLRALKSGNSFHEEGRQEDAEEFLSSLLNKLHDEMLELQKLCLDPKNPPVVNGDLTSNGDAHSEDGSVWEEVMNKGSRVTRRAESIRTPLSDIFRGQLRSSVHRPELSSSSDSVQPFYTLQLDIESSETVTQALEKLVGRYPVEGASPTQDVMFQQQSLEKLPCVLILHLKCFYYKQETPSKIIKSLEFPVDLKLDQKLLSNKNQIPVKARQYKLFAVVYHDGKEATKGHYLTDVFYLGGGSPGWIRYDDAAVNPISESQVLNPKPPRVPYLLYYRRADTIGAQNSLVPKS